MTPTTTSRAPRLRSTSRRFCRGAVGGAGRGVQERVGEVAAPHQDRMGGGAEQHQVDQQPPRRRHERVDQRDDHGGHQPAHHRQVAHRPEASRRSAAHEASSPSGGRTRRHAPGSANGSSALPAGSAPYSVRAPRTMPEVHRADDLRVPVGGLQEGAAGEPRRCRVFRLDLGREAQVVEQGQHLLAERPRGRDPWRRGRGPARGPTPRRRPTPPCRGRRWCGRWQWPGRRRGRRTPSRLARPRSSGRATPGVRVRRAPQRRGGPGRGGPGRRDGRARCSGAGRWRPTSAAWVTGSGWSRSRSRIAARDGDRADAPALGRGPRGLRPCPIIFHGVECSKKAPGSPRGPRTKETDHDRPSDDRLQ